MGNSVGMIVPKAILQEIGAGAGTAMDMCVEDGRVVATPVRKVREGWAEDAARIAALKEDPDEAAWEALSPDDDGEWTW